VVISTLSTPLAQVKSITDLAKWAFFGFCNQSQTTIKKQLLPNKFGLKLFYFRNFLKSPSLFYFYVFSFHFLTKN